jgi:hypothetical protein
MLLVAWALVVAVGYALFLEVGWRVVGYLPGYLTPYEFYNLSARHLLTWLFSFITSEPYRYVQAVGGGILLLTISWTLRQGALSELATIRRGITFIALYLLVVSPSVFPWYLLWLLALATLVPTSLTPAWLYWSWSVNIDCLEPLFGQESPQLWLRLVEYVPLYLWLVGYWWWGSRGSKNI